jgi:ABC-type molybdate transport system ATPase subunit
MKRGRLLQIGPREELFRRPNSASVAEIVGFENRLPARVQSVDGDYATLGFGAVTLRASARLPIGTRVIACIRAEDLSLNSGACASQSPNRLKGKITDLTPGVGRDRVTLNCGGVALIGLLDRNESQALALEPGTEVIAGVDAAAIHVIADEKLC